MSKGMNEAEIARLEIRRAALNEALAECGVASEDRIGVPCPDNKPGCCVFHFKRVVRPRSAMEIAAAIRLLMSQ